MNTAIALYCLISFLVGIGVTFGLFKAGDKKRNEKAQVEADRFLADARVQAENHRSELLLAAKESALLVKASAEEELASGRKSQLIREQKLDRRDELLHQQEDALRKQQRGLESSQTRLAAQMKSVSDQRIQLDQTLKQQQEILEKASGMSRAEATEKLMASLEQDLEHERGSVLLRHKKTLSEVVNAQARVILLTAIQRYSSAHTAESTTSTVDVPTDDMKGRIIGREGRNIRAFEKATGVDVIIDDTPGVVIVSGFDPVRREIARQSLGALIADGRIHPSKIEEVVEETTKKIEDFIMQKGREAADEVNVPGLHDKIIRMLGRLHFRTSYSQNVLRHSVEVAFISGMVAEMIGMDGDLARRCGLLHDIGKAADHELEGGHPKIGADMLRRNGEGPEVVHAALGHHDEIVTEHPYTMLVATGDACSASRPGARRESLERYVKRMEELESIATRFDGVRQAFAISAGRELRVIVASERTTDEEAARICHDIAKAFESELTYPGEIKVTVVRESRFIETAK
ncbi:Ribonuclease Y [Rubripirellula lacrimiformis]|uniref:Ribonuclease Y n=1 Tax=Rubripirellula lacrimiformis TaxID=1930273 RepID=A0A517NG25_9BACT|nr:ribonuclease Y [Rubripirellula lacrimiformis]QDT06061.1 Ribonuclease Y [Rubripirellula lacrimiformis]